MGGEPSKPIRPTSLQLGLLVETELGQLPGVNVEQLSADVAEPLESEHFEAAWQRAVDELDALRMTFRRGEQGSVEVSFAPQALIRCRTLDWSTKTPQEQEELFSHHLEGDRKQGLRYDEAPAMRVRCLLLGPAHWRLLWTFHQSLLDGPSIGLVLARVFEVYQALKNGQPVPERSAPSYRDHLEKMGSQGHRQGEAYFSTLLQGFSEPTPLPFERRNGSLEPAIAGEVRASMSGAQTAKLRAFARAQRVSLKAIASFCWGVLLSRYSGESDLVFGTTWSWRDDAQHDGEPIVGFMTNTTPLRLTLKRDERVHEALARMHTQLSEVRELRHTPLPRIHANSSVRSNRHLFNSAVITDHGSLRAQLERKLPGLLSHSIGKRSLSGIPLLLSVHFEEEQTSVELAYADGILTRGQATQIVEQYLRLVVNAFESPEAEAATLRMLDDEVFRKLVTEQTERELEGSQAPPVVDEIRARAQQKPDAIAVEASGGEPLSYAELDSASDAVASELRQRRCKVAALVLPRSPNLIVAILGAMRARVTFVPVDPEYPEERVRYLLEDSGADVILTDDTTRPKVPRTEAPLVTVDSMLGGTPSTRPPRARSEDLEAPTRPAYLIYTSGSTGRPKGVAVSHAALANHCRAIRDYFELKPRDRVLQFASPSFDVALEEIIPTLAAGATLVIRDDRSVASIRDFFEYVEDQRISVLNLPTAFWQTLVHHTHARLWPLCVRLLVVGGEKASRTAHQRFRQEQSAHIRWLNGYGPTEATITSTLYDDAENDHEAALPIGRPIDGVSHFILDAERRLMPPGAVGQLYIGGVGLADGYNRRPKATREAFIPHPFRSSGRLYATGDLAFMTQRGNFVYVDRGDNQLKIRGYRVEPGEIEAKLQALPQVLDAVVMPDFGRQVTLTAHVLCEGELDAEQLRKQLAERLPSYMIPSTYRLHERFPKTPSGKVDRKALAKGLTGERRSSRIGPSSSAGFDSPLERTVSGVWRELLRSDVADPTDDFFERGGSSLLLLELFSELERRLDRRPNPQAFLKEPTLANLIRLLGHFSAKQWASPIVRMADGADTVRPLFLATGVSGSASDFVHLVEALDPRIPVYALQINRMGGDSDAALRRYARTCASDMKLVQPEGAFAIAGYSAGSIFALAVAEALLEQGESVDFLASFDGTAPTSVARKSPFSSPRRFVRLARTTSARVSDFILDPELLKRRIAKAWTRSGAIWRGEEFRHDVGELFDSGEEAIPARTRALWQRNLDAMMQYAHRELPLDIVLFRTELDPFEGPHCKDLGWSAVLSGAISVEIFPGKHFELLTREGAPILAAQLEPHLLDRRRRLNTANSAA